MGTGRPSARELPPGLESLRRDTRSARSVDVRRGTDVDHLGLALRRSSRVREGQRRLDALPSHCPGQHLDRQQLRCCHCDEWDRRRDLGALPRPRLERHRSRVRLRARSARRGQLGLGVAGYARHLASRGVRPELELHRLVPGHRCSPEPMGRASSAERSTCTREETTAPSTASTPCTVRWTADAWATRSRSTGFRSSACGFWPAPP